MAILNGVGIKIHFRYKVKQFTAAFYCQQIAASIGYNGI